MPTIICDYREGKTKIPEILKNLGCKVEAKNLEIGDYLTEGNVCIERKTFQDFVSSIVDGRLFNQVRELKEKYEKSIIVIEGNDYYANVSINAVYGAIASVAIDYAIPLVFLRNQAEVARFLFILAKREEKPGKKEKIQLHRKKPKSIKEMQEYLVASFPGINAKLAKELLKKFGAPIRIFNANRTELLKVAGLGEKKIKRMKDILETKYRE